MHLNRLSGFLFAGLLCVLTACGAQGKPATAAVHFYPDTNPALLSEWGVLSASKGALRLSKGVVPYDLNTPLFTAWPLWTLWKHACWSGARRHGRPSPMSGTTRRLTPG